MTRGADRLLALLELLRGRQISTAESLAATLEVSIRTEYRDIDALVTTEEAEALALGARVLAIWSDRAVAGQAASALAKMRAVLPASGQAGVDQDLFWTPQ